MDLRMLNEKFGEVGESVRISLRHCCIMQYDDLLYGLDDGPLYSFRCEEDVMGRLWLYIPVVGADLSNSNVPREQETENIMLAVNACPKCGYEAKYKVATI